MNIMEFGAYLKSLREQKSLTLTELGDLIGYSNPYLSQIENGKRKAMPSPELLGKLSEALGVSYFDLMSKAGHWQPMDVENLIEERNEKTTFHRMELNMLEKHTLDYLELKKNLQRINEKISNKETSSEEINKLKHGLEDFFYQEKILNERIEERMSKINNLTIEIQQLNSAIEDAIDYEGASEMHHLIEDFVINKEKILLDTLLKDSQNIYFNEKKISNHQRIQLLRIAEILFSEELEQE
ncbi:helix-turn-helix domain-containing protein [Sporosarcina sp. P17b]|uniref:helix-turn-helix domain-containing protein n=1 Tax=Sporosarcina sp. P17b TaxID=2048260 RepID=UPI0013041F41|nr:helix-turn-helix transcriptional regulator [Sporosarcina sp. P17b]